MAMRVAIEKSKEETQTKVRQERAAMEVTLTPIILCLTNS